MIDEVEQFILVFYWPLLLWESSAERLGFNNIAKNNSRFKLCTVCTGQPAWCKLKVFCPLPPFLPLIGMQTRPIKQKLNSTWNDNFSKDIPFASSLDQKMQNFEKIKGQGGGCLNGFFVGKLLHFPSVLPLLACLLVVKDCKGKLSQNQNISNYFNISQLWFQSWRLSPRMHVLGAAFRGTSQL